MLLIDTSLVLPWSDKLIEEEPYEYPFKATYSFASKYLEYVAAEHSSTSCSDTFILIESIFERLKPELLIVEGVPNSLGLSPVSFVNWAKEQGVDGFYSGFETAFSIQLAIKNCIPFIGGEPDDEFVIGKLEQTGFSVKDYLYYHFVQQVYQADQSGVSTSVNINDTFKEVMSHKCDRLKSDTVVSLDDFCVWFRNGNHTEFSLDDINSETCAPYKNGDKMTQQISSALCFIRDQFIVAQIVNCFDRFQSIVAIFGGSHWSTQRLALEYSLGLPVFDKLKI